tara:strand:- start:294 stop:443 length:150 start_codon:yes stop_codon:yes gene_type:complete
MANEKNRYLIYTIDVKKLIKGSLENREFNEIIRTNIKNKITILFLNNSQ